MIIEALDRHGIHHKEQSGQIRVNCQHCGDTNYHLYIDPEKRVYYCHKCGGKGTWYKLLKELMTSISIVPFSTRSKRVGHPSVEYICQCNERLTSLSGAHTLEYLYSRRFTLQAIQDFKLGLESKDGKDWLVIPYFKNGKPVNVKYRSLPPADKEFRRWKDGESILFNQDCLKSVGDEIILVEGELDAIALWSHGYRNAIATTIGARAFKPEWIDDLDRFKRIIITYDSDTPGQKGATDVAKRLGFERCFNILLPTKDINDFFISGAERSDFDSLVEKASGFHVDNIMDLHSAVSELRTRSARICDNNLIKPHWQNVANLTGSFEPGDLITLSATPKTGKTTFALNIVRDFIRQDIPCLFYCLEMRPERLIKKVLQMEMEVSETELDAETIAEGYARLTGKPLYFGYNYRISDLNLVRDTIVSGVRRYGFKFVVFDNLHFLSRSLTNPTQEVALISKTFKLLAEEMGIPIMLIAQPRKIAEGQVMGMMDLRDSSSIGADSDQVIILYRRKTKTADGTAATSYEPLTLVRVDASRYYPGGETLLHFDGATCVFKELKATEKDNRGL